MRRVGFLLVSVLVLAPPACTRGYRSEDTRGDLRVTLMAESYPLVMGRNVLRLDIAHRNGGSLPDGARVEVRYGLPPMPGMGAVTKTVEASRDDGQFVFEIGTHTRGTWHLLVVVQLPYHPESNHPFTVETL